MVNLIRADLYKLGRSSVFRFLLAMTILCASAMALIAYLISQGNVDASISGFGFLFSDMNVLSILGAVLAGTYICGDFENKTIHQTVAGGGGRGTVVAAKMVVFALALGALIMPYALISGVLSAGGGEYSMGSTVPLGFLNVLVSGAGPDGAGVLKLAAIHIALMLMYVAQLSLCLPLAMWLRRSVHVVGLYYGISVGMGQALSLSAKWPVAERVLGWTPFGREQVFMTLDASGADVFRSLIACMVFTVLMVALAYAGFKKAEIK